MKYFIVIIGLISYNSIFSQIINGNFEEWEIIDMFGQPYENPVGWKTNKSNYPKGLANTPVTKGIDSLGFHARIESNDNGIDALLPGVLSQSISTAHLIQIDYSSRCTYIFQSGRCVVNILGQDQEDILYTDSISIPSTEFQSSSINIESDWIEGNDSITIQFVAKGNLDKWDEEEDGHSIFLIDNVSAEYISSVDLLSVNSSFKMFPNPTSGFIRIQTTEGFHPNQIEFLTITGDHIATQAFSDISNLNWLPNGMYFVKLSGDEGSMAEVLIVHR